MTSIDRPIVIMAFANPTGDLVGIQKEIGAIKDIFHKHEKSVDLRVEQRIDLEGIRKSFQRARDRVVLFHFAGHADSFGLMFETPDGKPQGLSGENFARFVGTQENLDVVFLNGCETEQQIQDQLEAGAQCVIGTNVEIDDESATTFAKTFYEGLCTGATIDKAFKEASQAPQLDGSKKTRASFFGKNIPAGDAWSTEFPWQIRYANDDARQWSLMKLAHKAAQDRDSMVHIGKKEKRDLVKFLRIVAFKISGADDSESLNIGRELRLEGLQTGPEEETQVLGPEHSVIDVFDDVNRKLLVLGQPGSGKTTCLEELARNLISRAEDNIEAGVPVYIPLSSFADQKQSLASWLEGELKNRYDAPRKHGAKWIENERLILLLDGLDEVRASCRAACVDAIHEFLDDRLHQGICVSCRVQEYEALDAKLDFHGAINLQPLTKQQIREFIDSGGPEMASLGQIFAQHKPLQELAKSPLMLDIMSRSYKNLDIDALDVRRRESPEGWRDHVFDTYIDREFSRVSADNQPFKRKQTVGWLGWLAQKIDTQSLSTILQIEALQPEWLEGSRERALNIFGISVFMAMLGTLITGTYWYAISPVSTTVRTATGINNNIGLAGNLDSYVTGFVIPVFFVFLLWHVAISLADKILPNFNRHHSASTSKKIQQGAVKIATFALLWYLISEAVTYFANGTPALWSGSKLAGVLTITGVMGSMLYGSYGSDMRCFSRIRTVETVGISSQGVLSGTLKGAILGSIIWLLYWVIWESTDGVREPDMYFWDQPAPAVYTDWVNGLYAPSHGYYFFLLAFLLIGVTAGMFFGGRVPKVVNVKTKTLANEGIRLSARNALLSGIFLGGATFMVIFAIFALQDKELRGEALIIQAEIVQMKEDGRSNEDIESVDWDAFKEQTDNWDVLVQENGPTWNKGLSFSSGCALMAFYFATFWFGGFDVIKHYVLRLVLIIFGRLPRNVAAFLDHASELSFMKKRGGGYMFKHGLLREHFAAMNSLDDERNS